MAQSRNKRSLWAVCGDITYFLFPLWNIDYRGMCKLFRLFRPILYAWSRIQSSTVWRSSVISVSFCYSNMLLVMPFIEWKASMMPPGGSTPYHLNMFYRYIKIMPFSSLSTTKYIHFDLQNSHCSPICDTFFIHTLMLAKGCCTGDVYSGPLGDVMLCLSPFSVVKLPNTVAAKHLFVLVLVESTESMKNTKFRTGTNNKPEGIFYMQTGCIFPALSFAHESFWFAFPTNLIRIVLCPVCVHSLIKGFKRQFISIVKHNTTSRKVQKSPQSEKLSRI